MAHKGGAGRVRLGAVLSATVNLADRRRLSALIAASAALAGATNLLVPLLVHDLTQAPPWAS